MGSVWANARWGSIKITKHRAEKNVCPACQSASPAPTTRHVACALTTRPNTKANVWHNAHQECTPTMACVKTAHPPASTAQTHSPALPAWTTPFSWWGAQSALWARSARLASTASPTPATATADAQQATTTAMTGHATIKVVMLTNTKEPICFATLSALTATSLMRLTSASLARGQAARQAYFIK